jgi:hypothetical protein
MQPGGGSRSCIANRSCIQRPTVRWVSVLPPLRPHSWQWSHPGSGRIRVRDHKQHGSTLTIPQAGTHKEGWG